jgi:DNA-binding LacI/PurR family transcriptional regulator
MRAHLVEHGFTAEILVCQTQSVAAQRHTIEAFLRQNHVFCCVLLSVGKELQQWFAENSIPALVLGSCHLGVKLPSLDVDYRSVCRHAAGIFLGKGHRRIALIVPNSGVAGDLASERGFLEAVEKRKTKDEAHGHIVRHNGTPANLTAKLDELFSAPQPPTALLVAKPQHTLWVIIFLLRRGLIVPDTVSVIARDHEYLFENAVAHYTFESDLFARRLSHLVLQMAGQGFLAAEPSLGPSVNNVGLRGE